MSFGSGALRPTVFSLSLVDGEVVDAGDAPLHQAVGSKLPILVAIGQEPVTLSVIPLVSEAHGDAVFGEGPELLDQPIVVLALPFAGEKGFDLGRGP